MFNMAMLAKQFWRLHSHSISFFVKVLKVRYGPSPNICKAKLGYLPSFSWHSIWGSKSLVEIGVQWKVGDSKSISMWFDAWLRLRREGLGKVNTPLKVEKLIHSANGEWRNEILRRCSSQLMQREYSTFTWSILTEEMRCWVGSDDGVFFVWKMHTSLH